MSYNITDFSELEIEVTDSVRTWYIPKFRIYMTVDEPYCYLYWTDTEKGSPGITRKLILDYNDVTFGMLTPTSASEVKQTIEGYMISAFPNLSGYVPYTGATQNVDLTPYGLTADFVAFSQTPTVGPGQAQIGYVGNTLALAYDFDSTSVRCQIGQQLYAYVKNAEAVTITKGQAVYLYQASGNKATIKLAKNTSDQYSAKTLGLAAEDIAAGQNGLVICQGVLDGIDTSMFVAGDTLYLANTFGDLTATKPYAPEHLVYIGVVERANAGAGQIYVRPQNGYELSEIHDVDLITTPPSTGDVLTYNGTLWVNQAPTSGTGTVTSIATSSPITGGTITTSGTIGITQATTSTNGYLSSTDWNTFNGKEPALTKGNLTEATSSVLTISGGTSAVIGSGTSIQVNQANGAQSGYLSSADWTTFNSKQAALVSGTNIKTINGTSILGSGDLDTGYTLSVQALTSSPVDAQTIYFGNLPKAPVTTANISKVYIPRAGNITRAEIYCYSGTAGTAENWSCYIRKNNTTDTLVQTIGAATNERRFNNSSLAIAVVAGDYIEIKMINPTWATNPLTTIFGGYIYIE